MTKKFFALIAARNKEFYRDKGTLAWGILFPFLVIGGFGFAFSGKSADLFKVGVLNGAAVTEKPAFLSTQHVQFVDQTDLDKSLALLKRHQVDLLVSLAPPTYWVNDESPKGYLVEKILFGSTKGFAKETVSGAEIRYVDWLISGLLAMNLMFSALFGVGYTIVRYRKNGVLKRLKATPVGAFEFLCAQVVSRLMILVVVTTIVYAGCHFLVRFRMHGSYFNLALVLAMGSICLISLGLVVAARIRSEEFAGGVLNLISWPMIFLSGVWFSLEGMHPVVRAVAQVFPLTHVIDAARAIMTEGAGLAEVAFHLVVLGVMSVVFLVFGAVSFKWE